MSKGSALLFLSAITTVITTIPNKTCNRLRIGDSWYDREVLWANLGRPYSLNVHRATNTLFFSYSTAETYSDVDFQLAYYHIDKREYDVIVGIKGGCAVAIDQYSDEIYLGGSDGIYKYNMMTRIADVYKEKGINVWSLFFKKNLFYISYPNQRLHIEIDGNFSVVKEFENFEVDNFFMSASNDIFFSNKTGFYKYDNTKMAAQIINELLVVRQLTEDNEDNMYLSTNIGVFMYIPYVGLKKILGIKNIYGVTFDRNNNMIYSDENSIVLLKYSVKGCAHGEVAHW